MLEPKHSTSPEHKDPVTLRMCMCACMERAFMRHSHAAVCYVCDFIAQFLRSGMDVYSFDSFGLCLWRWVSKPKRKNQNTNGKFIPPLHRLKVERVGEGNFKIRGYRCIVIASVLRSGCVGRFQGHARVYREYKVEGRMLFTITRALGDTYNGNSKSKLFHQPFEFRFQHFRFQSQKRANNLHWNICSGSGNTLKLADEALHALERDTHQSGGLLDYKAP